MSAEEKIEEACQFERVSIGSPNFYENMLACCTGMNNKISGKMSL